MSWRSVQVDGKRFLLGEHGGRAWAIEDRCSHADCSFSSDGEVVDGVAVCDCHGSEFDVFTGQVVRPPAREPIETLPAVLIEGNPELAT